MVSFSQAMKNTLDYCVQYDFTGRSCRSEFWWSWLGFALIDIIFTLIVTVVNVPLYNGIIYGDITEGGLIYNIAIFFNFILFIISLLLINENILMSIRRLHDCNKSGWWYLIIFLPFGVIVLLIMFCLKGTTGPNRFGPDPLDGIQPVATSSHQGHPHYQQAPQQMVSFTQAVKNTLTYCKHFDFKGRSCRSEFWWASLGICLIEVATTLLFCLIFALLKPLSEEAALIFVGIDILAASILGAYANILISIRRLHDRNMYGWWYLMILIPYVGWAALIVLFCLKGTTGPNRFGPDPLGEIQSVDPSSYQGPHNYQQAPQQYVAPTQPIGQPIQQGQPFSADTPSRDKDL